MGKYRKLPVEIEAFQLLENDEDNVFDFVNDNGGNAYFHDGDLIIKTLEGDMTASDRDFIIKGVNGEFYPCKPDIFYKTYESVDEE